MQGISRRAFLKTASASAACAALWNSVPWLMADPLGLPLGLQLYSVRDILPKDYEGTLNQLSLRLAIAKWRLRASSATRQLK
jgi:hypothetical protein